MTVLVSNIPDNPEDCLFYKEKYSRLPYTAETYISYCCGMNDESCKLEKYGTCTKLEAKYG